MKEWIKQFLMMWSLILYDWATLKAPWKGSRRTWRTYWVLAQATIDEAHKCMHEDDYESRNQSGNR
jgi:hypothetical protein